MFSCLDIFNFALQYITLPEPGVKVAWDAGNAIPSTRVYGEMRSHTSDIPKYARERKRNARYDESRQKLKVKTTAAANASIQQYSQLTGRCGHSGGDFPTDWLSGSNAACCQLFGHSCLFFNSHKSYDTDDQKGTYNCVWQRPL